MFCIDEGFQEVRLSQARPDLVRLVRPRLCEIVVENLPDHGPGLLGVSQEVVQLQHPRVVLAPQAAGAPEGWDAAFHGNAGTGESGEVAGASNEGGCFVNVRAGFFIC